MSPTALLDTLIKTSANVDTYHIPVHPPSHHSRCSHHIGFFSKCIVHLTNISFHLVCITVDPLLWHTSIILSREKYTIYM